MKAAVHKVYGSPDVLAIEEIPTPSPKENEILIRVHATTVTRTDTCALRAHPFFLRPYTGFFRPRRKVLGLDFAGTVVSIGAAVSRFSVGQRVFGLTPDGCGAHAEYLCLCQNDAIAGMPDNRDFHEVVTGEGAWYANTYLEAFNIGPGQNILVYGASGAIGTAAVQLSKYRGANVTAVVSTKDVELAKRLGADQVVDYTVEGFTAVGDKFDFVLDAVGKTTYFACKPLLKASGVYSATDLGPYWQNVWLTLWYGQRARKRVIFPTPGQSREFMEFLSGLMGSGRFQAVIDRYYDFEEIAEAFRFVETGNKTGIVVIRM
jgi:NADPH:quinone reductase-like Zn-dependent oxidoreductase